MSTKSTTAHKRQCENCVSQHNRTHLSRSTRTKTPSPERILAFVEGNACVSGGINDVVDCIVADQSCREAISFVVAATAARVSGSLAPDMAARRVSAALTWHRLSAILAIRSRIAEKVESDGIDAIAAESGENSLVFKSVRDAPPALAWRAELELPPADTVDAPLKVRVSTRSGTRAGDGTFTICGVRVAIVDGAGTVPRKALVEGLATGGVSFEAKGKKPVAGTPVFGSLE